LQPAPASPTIARLRLRAVLPAGLRARLDLHRRAVLHFVEDTAASLPKGARVLDAGAGEGPYRPLFGHVRYVALDDRRGDRNWDYGHLDAVGDLLRMPFRDAAFDAVLCTETLEHLTEPQGFLREVARVLRPGGRLHMTAPLDFREHQEPHDYFRYTRHGLRMLSERAGLRPLSIEPEGGYFRMLGDKIQPAHRHLFGKDRAFVWKVLFLPLHPFSMLFFTVIAPSVCVLLDPIDRRRKHTTGFLVVAEKP
jgi:SAM-dependent methyltransferase